jgi:hypothetical protein
MHYVEQLCLFATTTVSRREKGAVDDTIQCTPALWIAVEERPVLWLDWDLQGRFIAHLAHRAVAALPWRRALLRVMIADQSSRADAHSACLRPH